jgi:tetratricopeptide (TPR) repeat protein
MGNAFRLLERPDSAEACYRFANRIDPTSYPAYERLGSLFSKQNRLQEAEQAYLGAIAVLPDYWVAHRFLGLFYYHQHRLKDAEHAWQSALKFAPDDIHSLNNLGVAYYYLGEVQPAQEIFLHSFRIRPDCNSCNNVATALFLEGRFKDAASYFELALSREYCDSTSGALGNLASALYWVDDERPRAVDLYRRAISVAETELSKEPDSAELIARLVDYYAMSGDSLRARAMIARAEPFLDDDSYVMYRIGSALEKLGDRSVAIHHLGNAVRHGYAKLFIERDPVLRDLIADPVFQQMTRNDEAAEGASAATNNR